MKFVSCKLSINVFRLCANHTKDSLSTSGKPIGRHCEVGDRIGCGIRKAPGAAQTAADVMFGGPQCKLEVYFTINDVEVNIFLVKKILSTNVNF